VRVSKEGLKKNGLPVVKKLKRIATLMGRWGLSRRGLTGFRLQSFLFVLSKVCTLKAFYLGRRGEKEKTKTSAQTAQEGESVRLAVYDVSKGMPASMAPLRGVDTMEETGEKGGLKSSCARAMKMYIKKLEIYCQTVSVEGEGGARWGSLTDGRDTCHRKGFRAH